MSNTTGDENDVQERYDMKGIEVGEGTEEMKGVEEGKGTEEGKEGKKIDPLNFMDLVPVRAQEHIQQEWQVGFKQLRFESRFWNKFFVRLGATDHLIVRLDRMGSEIFGYVDGERNVRQILVLLELKHRDEDGLRDRLVEYLKRLKFHGFIDLTRDGQSIDMETN